MESTEAREELIGPYRLVDVIERTQGWPELWIIDNAPHDDRDGSGWLVALKLGQDLPAIEPGKDDVKQDRHRLQGACHVLSLAAGTCDFRSEATPTDDMRD